MASQKTDNELIAEFMGYPSFEKNGKRYWRIISMKWDHFATESKDLRYDKKWDDLMPVVEKIHEIHPQAFDVDHELGPLSDLAGIQICDGIERIYKAVVDFIKWYNEQKPK